MRRSTDSISWTTRIAKVFFLYLTIKVARTETEDRSALWIAVDAGGVADAQACSKRP